MDATVNPRYLAIRAGAPRTPETRPDAVAVSVDLSDVARPAAS